MQAAGHGLSPLQPCGQASSSKQTRYACRPAAFAGALEIGLECVSCPAAAVASQLLQALVLLQQLQLVLP
jgi:hypothetical protein